MHSTSPRAPSTLTDACRTMLMATLAYAVAIALVAASVPMLLAALSSDAVVGRALQAIAPGQAAHVPESSR